MGLFREIHSHGGVVAKTLEEQEKEKLSKICQDGELHDRPNP